MDKDSNKIMKTVVKWNNCRGIIKEKKMTESHIKLKALSEEYVNENEKFKEGAGVKASAKSKKGIDGNRKTL